MPNDISNCDEKLVIDDYCLGEKYYTYDEQKCLQMFFNTIDLILNNYMFILFQSIHHACLYPRSCCLGKNKFVEVRKQLFEFLYMHKDFIKINAVIVKPYNSNKIKKIRFYYLNDDSKLLDYTCCLKTFRWLIKLVDGKRSLTKKFSIDIKSSYNRENTLEALKNLSKLNTITEKSMINLDENYFIGNIGLVNTHKIESYEGLIDFLEDDYLEHTINFMLEIYVVDVVEAYISYLNVISLVDRKSNIFSIHLRKFEEVSNELYKFAAAHKSVIEIKDVYVVHSTKPNLKFTKVNFDFSKNGRDFICYSDLNSLNKTRCSLERKLGKFTDFNINFNFNKSNVLEGFGLLADKKFESYYELEPMCLDSMFKEAQIRISYENFIYTLDNRIFAFTEGKVSCAFFDNLCSTYEGSTGENGETPQCCICMEEPEVGVEICQLPCGHSNCKACILTWFHFRVDDSNDFLDRFLEQIPINQCPVCRQICS